MTKTAVFKPVSKELVSDKIIHEIKTAIEEGQFKAGDRLPSEMEMARSLKVGRSTVREALKVLIHLGIVRRVGRITVVAEDPFDFGTSSILLRLARYRDYQNAVDMIEVLLFLEGEITQLAAERANETDIRDLEFYLRQMQRNAKDIDKFIEADLGFHIAVAQAAQNKILFRMNERTKRFRRETMELMIKNRPNILYKSLQYHEEIFEAIARHQHKKARKTMQAHLKDVESEFRAILRQDSHPNS